MMHLSFLSSYRSAIEVKGVRETRDPLKKCEELALELNLMTSDEIKVCTVHLIHRVLHTIYITTECVVNTTILL